MLSVLIPIFDWNLTKLVNNLHLQLIKSGISFEILISDNCQNSEHFESNDKLNQLDQVKYFRDLIHIGRSANRNNLADLAKYPWLLFLDGDTAISSPNFIENYLNATPSNSVICGGTAYEPNPPKDQKKHLRWLYGKTKESVPLAQRQLTPFKAYSSFNFLIHKEIFQQIRFNKNLTQYGHEDTLFGIELKTKKIPITHIDNPLIHLGLDDAESFIAKTKVAVENLKYLIDKNMIDEDVKLYKYYLRLKKIRLANTIGASFKKREAYLMKKITESQPNLHYFDLFKLYYLCSLMR
jgi:glycosyltransferase involved in cell wall biosynthesis